MKRDVVSFRSGTPTVNRRRPRRASMVASLCALALVAAACGDDEVVKEAEVSTAPAPDTAAPETAAPDTAAVAETTPPEADTTAAPETTVAAPTGEPILIGAVLSSQAPKPIASVRAGLDAGAHRINAAGGIDGRPLEVVTCEDEADANVAAECAQSLIDQGIVAFVSEFHLYRSTTGPLQAAQGFANVGGFPLGVDDLLDPTVFTTNGGAISLAGGIFATCSQLGAKNIAVGSADVDGADLLIDLFGNKITPAHGGTMVASVKIPLTTADFAPFAAQILEAKPDCVGFGGPPEQSTPLHQALIQAGYTGTIALSAATYTPPDIVEAFGADVANTIVMPGAYRHESEGWAMFTEDMAAAAPDVPLNDIAANGWLGVMVLADLIKEVGPDHAAIAAAAAALKGYDTMGMTALPLDWTTPGTNPHGLPLGSVRQPQFIVQTFENGEVVPQGGFIDIWTGQPVG